MKFTEELETWRRKIDKLSKNSGAERDPKWAVEKLAEAVCFLLAAAHQNLSTPDEHARMVIDVAPRDATPSDVVRLAINMERERCAQVALAAAAKYSSTEQATIAVAVANAIADEIRK